MTKCMTAMNAAGSRSVCPAQSVSYYAFMNAACFFSALRFYFYFYFYLHMFPPKRNHIS